MAATGHRINVNLKAAGHGLGSGGGISGPSSRLYRVRIDWPNPVEVLLDGVDGVHAIGCGVAGAAYMGRVRCEENEDVDYRKATGDLCRRTASGR